MRAPQGLPPRRLPRPIALCLCTFLWAGAALAQQEEGQKSQSAPTDFDRLSTIKDADSLQEAESLEEEGERKKNVKLLKTIETPSDWSEASPASGVPPLSPGFTAEPKKPYRLSSFGEVSDPESNRELLEQAENAGLVVSSAARHRQLVGMSPSAITVITREDIATSGASSIPDLLRQVPGMEVVNIYPDYTAVSSRMYWSWEGQYYLVLIDGREANFELLGWVFWAGLPISLEDIERIEIIRGPGSSLYGANAMAGVISITTRAVPQESYTSFHVQGGESGTQLMDLRSFNRFHDVGLSVGAGGKFQADNHDATRPLTQIGLLRAVLEYDPQDGRKWLLDSSLSFEQGPMALYFGYFDMSSTTAAIRLAYESEPLKARVYWQENHSHHELDAPLEYSGFHLGDFSSYSFVGRTFDGEIQWNPPRLLDPLLIICGAVSRLSFFLSDEFLDGETYTDPASSRYRTPGVDYLEWRAGAFLHLELAPARWVTLTAGARYDYNNVTESSFSPRFAAVFEPVTDQFVRVGVGEAFRKPAFFETGTHQSLDLTNSDIPVPAWKEELSDFMARAGGNPALENEKLRAFEAGYLGYFLDRALTVTLDVYYNVMTRLVILVSDIRSSGGLIPDIENSSLQWRNNDAVNILGSELALEWSPLSRLSLMTSASVRKIEHVSGSQYTFESPTLAFTLGGRYRSPTGLLGSAYAFLRSGFDDDAVQNPAGLIEPLLEKHRPPQLNVLARIGWAVNMYDDYAFEIGTRIFFPVELGAHPEFLTRDAGGGVTADGSPYGGQLLGRVVSFYLQGSF